MPTERSYSHSEFERYIQKQMSASEMHAFEKAMMNDPFLADALEGYQAAEPGLARQHLSEIRDELNATDEHAKVVGFGFSAKWLRIAAIFIVIISAGIITFRLLSTPEENMEMASTESPALAPQDSIGPTGEAIAQQSLPGKVANDNTKTASPIIEQNIISEKISSPLAMERSSNDSSLAALSDSNPRLQSSNAEKNTLSSANAAKELSEVPVNRSAAGSVDGWVKFQAYIDKEVSAAKEKNAALTGMKAEIEFSVDKNGTLEEIKILSASNGEVGKIAADILRKSPRWISLANNAKAKMILNF